MKSKYLCYLFVPALVLWLGCSKKVGVDAPTLDISVANGHLVNDTLTYKLGDTVKFAFTGYAGNISVYTGDAGFNYNYRNRTVAIGSPQLSFSFSTENKPTALDTLTLLATDKLTKLDSAHIVTANWTNISSRAAFSNSTSATPTPIINLSDIINGPTDSLFIAFRYKGTAGSLQKAWNITNYTLNNVLPDGSKYALSSLSTDVALWTNLSVAPSAKKWTVNTSQLFMASSVATATNTDCWVVSKPIYVGRVSPDVAVPLKNIGMANLPGFNYKYATAGTYTAVFVIFNNSVDEQKTVTKQFTIKIIP